MKKKISRLLSICILIGVVLLTSSCSRAVIVEDVVVEFWYSNDGGLTYFQGDGYHRGWEYSFYMKLRVQVHTDSNRAVFPTVSLHIGDSDNISAYIIGGPVVNPRRGLSSIIYDFSSRAVMNNNNFTELFVEFIPHRPGTIRMEVEFELDGNRLDEFKTYHSLRFLCFCGSISRNSDGRFNGIEPEILRQMAIEFCSCVEPNCSFCAQFCNHR